MQKSQSSKLGKVQQGIPIVLFRVANFEVFAFGAAQLFQIEVQHSGQPINQLGSEEGLFDVLG